MSVRWPIGHWPNLASLVQGVHRGRSVALRRYIAIVLAASASALGLAHRRGATRWHGTVATTTTTTPQVEWAGCANVFLGPRCVLGAQRRVTLWTSSPDAARWTFAVDDQVRAPNATEAVQGGWRVVIDVPTRARRLTAAAGPHVRPFWELPFEAAASRPSLDELVAQGKRGDPEALTRLRDLVARGEPHDAGLAQAGLGRVLLARGEMTEAEPALRAALRFDEREGRLL